MRNNKTKEDVQKYLESMQVEVSADEWPLDELKACKVTGEDLEGCQSCQ